MKSIYVQESDLAGQVNSLPALFSFQDVFNARDAAHSLCMKAWLPPREYGVILTALELLRLRVAEAKQ